MYRSRLSSLGRGSYKGLLPMGNFEVNLPSIICSLHTLPNGEVIDGCRMINTPQKGKRQEGIKMLSVGIDTHLEMHEVAIVNENAEIVWSGRVGNNRIGFQDLLAKLKTIEKSRNDKIMGMYANPTGNYHMPVSCFLRKSGYDVHEVNPILTSSIRKAMNMGKNKSDRVDSYSLALTPLYNKNHKNHERLSTSVLTRYRQKLTNEETRLINLLRCDLAAAFPEIMTILDMRKVSALKLIQEFPSPRLYEGNRERIVEILRLNGRGHVDLGKVDLIMKAASETVGIEDKDGFYSFRISETSRIIQVLIDSIEEVNRMVGEGVAGNTDIANIDAIRGIDIGIAASIVSEIGDIRQFDSAEKLQSYGGMTPSQSSSAGHMNGSWSSKISNPYLSATASIAARSLVWSRSPEFHAIYEREIRKGKAKKMAYMVVGKRFLYHIYSIMKNGKPYRQRMPQNGGEYRIPVQQEYNGP